MRYTTDIDFFESIMALRKWKNEILGLLEVKTCHWIFFKSATTIDWYRKNTHALEKEGNVRDFAIKRNDSQIRILLEIMPLKYSQDMRATILNLGFGKQHWGVLGKVNSLWMVLDS